MKTTGTDGKDAATHGPVKPLISKEEMDRIIASQRPITSEEFYAQMEAHLGRKMRPA